MDTKNEKDLREIEFLELRKKEKENKLMTATEMKKLSSYRTRELVNQVLRVLGLFATVFIFILTFDIFSEGAIWGVFSGRCEGFWQTLIHPNGVGGSEGYLRILWMMFTDDKAITVFGCLMMTIVHVGLCVIMGYLFAYSIRDLIGFIKRLVASPVTLIKEVGKTAQESVALEMSEEQRKALAEKKKKAATPKKKKPVVKKIEEPVEERAYTDEELNRMLQGETLEDIKRDRELAEAKEEVVEEPVAVEAERRAEPAEETMDPDLANILGKMGK